MIVTAIVVDPSPDHGIEHASDILERVGPFDAIGLFGSVDDGQHGRIVDLAAEMAKGQPGSGGCVGQHDDIVFQFVG